MAYVRMSNNKGIKITHDQAIDILDVLEGRKEPSDDKQAAFCEKVKKVYFSWRTADPIWIMQNIESVTEQALQEWSVDTNGRPARPSTDHAWKFARRYQLWSNGGPSGYAKNIIERYELKSRGYK